MRTYKTPKAILKHAAKLIEERGWCRGDYEDDDGRLCLIGAIRLASTGSSNRHNHRTEDAYRAFRWAENISDAVYWNDARSRSKHQVIKALLKASEAA